MKVFILERTGEFTITPDQFTETQCTKYGHMDYTYHIKCTMNQPVLDENGFLIDHHDIDTAVQEYFRLHDMTSCESMLVNCAEYVVKMISSVKNMVSFEMSMSPNMSKVVAKPTYILDKAEILSLQLDAQLGMKKAEPVQDHSYGKIEREDLYHLWRDNSGTFFSARDLSSSRLSNIIADNKVEHAKFILHAEAELARRDARVNEVKRARLVEDIFSELEWKYRNGRHALITDMSKGMLTKVMRSFEDKEGTEKVNGLSINTWLTAMKWAYDNK